MVFHVTRNYREYLEHSSNEVTVFKLNDSFSKQFTICISPSWDYKNIMQYNERKFSGNQKNIEIKLWKLELLTYLCTRILFYPNQEKAPRRQLLLSQ